MRNTCTCTSVVLLSLVPRLPQLFNVASSISVCNTEKLREPGDEARYYYQLVISLSVLMCIHLNIIVYNYCSIPGKHPLLGRHLYVCTEFQRVNVTASIQVYAIYILSKHPC